MQSIKCYVQNYFICYDSVYSEKINVLKCKICDLETELYYKEKQIKELEEYKELIEIKEIMKSFKEYNEKKEKRPCIIL